VKEIRKRGRSRFLHGLSILAKATLLLGLVTGVALTIYYGKNAIEADEYFRLESLEFEGASRFDQAAFAELFRRNFDSNLLTIDLHLVRSLVESEPWVKSAVVRRKFPHQLIIYVTEREPAAVAAIDNELYVVDAEGVVLDTFGPGYGYLDLPIVKGLRNIARENSLTENAKKIHLYFEVLEELRQGTTDYSEAISEIDVRNPDRVAVIPVEDPVSIYLGGNAFRRRYETFLGQKQLYYRLKEKYGLIEYVDVTYDDKIIFHTPNEAVAG